MNYKKTYLSLYDFIANKGNTLEKEELTHILKEVIYAFFSELDEETFNEIIKNAIYEIEDTSNIELIENINMRIYDKKTK